jgi:hypothetical protein
MSPRRYRAEQFAYAFVLAACGLAVAVGVIGKVLWDEIDEALALPRLPR